MPMYINTNVGSMKAQTNLNTSRLRLQQSFERLSSGYRINTAADDAAGMAVSENMRAQIRSLAVAERNSNNAISMTATAEGGLGEISNMLIRMRELAVQSANGDLTATERGYIDVEFQDLLEEIDRVANVTEFNGQELLAGPVTTIDFQVGIFTTTSDTISVDFGGVDTAGLGVAGTNVTGPDGTNSQAAMNAIDAALDGISARRAEFGAATNRFQTTISNLQTSRNNIEAANGVIRDVDVAYESAQLARGNVLQQAGTAILAQANQSPQLALQLLGG
ncbi:MAG: flagellin [Polyangiaceae bacterium]